MISRFILMIVALGGLAACMPQSGTVSNSPSTPTTEPSSSPIAEVSPTPQSDTIRVEGETRPITLKQYESTRFTTAVPNDYFVTDQAASGEGTATWFYYQQPNGSTNKDAYVQIFFPNSAVSAQELREFVVGNRGLFLVNGWKITGKETTNLYPWATEKITFEKRSQNQVVLGAVFLGQSNGRAFYAIEHYPGDYGDGFAPLADKILGNLKVRTQSAQLSNQSKLALNGIGNVRVGMTVAEASKAAGVPLVSEGSPVPGSQCGYVKPQRGTAGLNFMLDSDRIVRIDVRGENPITTLSGAKIGDTETRIKSLYPGQIEVSPHKYVPEGHYLTFVPKDKKDQNYRLIFETDGKQVTAFRSGKLPEVAWVEGCS